jgi:hypothetical protein
MVVINAILDFMPEMSDQSLDWPSCCIAEGADRMTFDLPCDFLLNIV